jgi:hypothetical protein
MRIKNLTLFAEMRRIELCSSPRQNLICKMNFKVIFHLLYFKNGLNQRGFLTSIM